jgi:hypothetical protein
MQYERADNCFPWIAKPERAQDLMEGFLDQRWPKILDELAITANPMLDALVDALGERSWPAMGSRLRWCLGDGATLVVRFISMGH